MQFDAPSCAEQTGPETPVSVSGSPGSGGGSLYLLTRRRLGVPHSGMNTTLREKGTGEVLRPHAVSLAPLLSAVVDPRFRNGPSPAPAHFLEEHRRHARDASALLPPTQSAPHGAVPGASFRVWRLSIPTRRPRTPTQAQAVDEAGVLGGPSVGEVAS